MADSAMAKLDRIRSLVFCSRKRRLNAFNVIYDQTMGDNKRKLSSHWKERKRLIDGAGGGGAKQGVSRGGGGLKNSWQSVSYLDFYLSW